MTSPEKRTQDGFNYHYYPAASGQNKALVVILHGHASSPERWQTRCAQLQDALPDAAVIALEGPLKAINKQGNDPVFGWLDFTTPTRQAKCWASHVFNKLSIVDPLNRFLKARLDEIGLDADRLALVGSSMGGIVALQAAFHNDKPYGAVLGYSTSVLPFTKMETKPEIYLAIGDNDNVFNKPQHIKQKPLSRAFGQAIRRISMQDIATQRRLVENGVTMLHTTYGGVGHEITDKMWDDGNKYIASRLKM